MHASLTSFDKFRNIYRFRVSEKQISLYEYIPLGRRKKKKKKHGYFIELR